MLPRFSGLDIEMKEGQLSLTKSHLPTGFIVIEDVIRFLISDLGVKPPCGQEWHERLRASEAAFHADFNTKIKGP